MNIPYRPLDQNRQEIRLLKQSSDSIRGGTLDYELIHYTFDEKYPYFALSYTWGQQELGKTITVDGKIVPVSQNLFAALNSLCDTSRATTGEEELSFNGWRRVGSEDHIAKFIENILQDELFFEIWVDALCINQLDDVEKSHQIKFMPSIYTNAYSVMMWLGEEEGNTKLAFKMIRDHPPDTLAELVSNGDKNSDQWKAFQRLLARPYWSRVWILQEVLLSGDRGIMCCGIFRIPWGMFALFLERCSSGLLTIATGISRSVIWNPRDSKSPFSLAAMYLQRRNPGSEFSLLDYLVLAQFRNCWNARDKVFGILGVCNSASMEEFKIDYSKSVKDIFRDTTLYLIQKDQNLDVLSACKHFNKTEFVALHFREEFEWLRDGSALGQDTFNQIRALFSRRQEEILATENQVYTHGYIPSWIPGWSKPVSKHLHLLLKNRERCHFQAAGDTKVRLHEGDNKNWLILEGFIIGRVETICLWATDPGHSLGQFWPVWTREAEHGNPYGNEEAQKLAYKVTLMSGRGPLGYKDDVTPSRSSVDALLGFRNLDPTTDIKQAIAVVDGIPQFEQAHIDNFLGGPYFITGEKYMGRGLPEMEKGDYICIFFGGKVPYILRKFHTKWLLLGECCKYAVSLMRT